MKEFLAIYTGNMETDNMKKWNAMDEKTRNEREKAGMEAWGAWGQKYEKAIVANGGPLGKTKRIDSKGIKDISNLMAAFTIVQAENHEAAAKMFIEHPHFTIFPGDGVEVMEVLPVPEMKK